MKRILLLMTAIFMMAATQAQGYQPLSVVKAELSVYEIKDVKEVCTKTRTFLTTTERTNWVNAMKQSYLVSSAEYFFDPGPYGPDGVIPAVTITYSASNCRTATLPSVTEQDAPIVKYNVLQDGCYSSQQEANEAYNQAYAVQKNCHFISDDDSGVYFNGCPYPSCTSWCFKVIGW